MAELLGYWSKGENIPVEIEIHRCVETKTTPDMTIGPGGRPIGDMAKLAMRWLSEEGAKFVEIPEGLQIVSSTPAPIIIRLKETGKADVMCNVELKRDTTDRFLRMGKDEVEAFLVDLKMVLSLRPCDFIIHTKSSLPVSIELKSTIYADGYSKDRLMSVLSNIRRSANLALMIVEGELKQTTIDRAIDRTIRGAR